MKKQAIMIGAGNIGRGFIGAVLSKNGYHVTFADVSDPLISAIQTQQHYTVYIRDAKTYSFTVHDIDAINSAGPELPQRICTASLITTAVGLRILPIVAKPIAAGITARKESGNREFLNILACENAVRATSQLKSAVYALLDSETAAFADTYIGFPDCAVDRIVPKASFDHILDVAVEEYFEWDVEKRSWKGTLPCIEGMDLVDNLSAYLERKLFTLNSGHAICAYLGCLRGRSTIQESVQDPEIGAVVYRAMQQSGAGLVRKFSLDATAHQNYIDRIFTRFQNPCLKDEVSRVGREPIRKLSKDDRLISPMLTAFSYGLPVDDLLLGAAAALHYSNPQDPQSVELQNTIFHGGTAAALTRYAGLSASHPLTGRILDISRALSI